MATLIASAAKSGIQPRALHAGVNVLHSVYSLTATLSAGDIIQVGRIPDGGRVIEASVGTPVALGTAGKLNLGDRGDHDRLIMSASFVTANRIFRMDNGAGQGYQYDVSDSANAANGTMLELKASDFTGTGTKSGAISTLVFYTIDP